MPVHYPAALLPSCPTTQLAYYTFDYYPPTTRSPQAVLKPTYVHNAAHNSISCTHYDLYKEDLEVHCP